MTDRFTQFILQHADEDPARLLLARQRWPDIDMDLAVRTIRARSRIRKKLPSWWDATGTVYPTDLCTQQCSSEDTARYKAETASRIVSADGKAPDLLADLTGGLGVDSAAFARVFRQVRYNERDPLLARWAPRNFEALGLHNISCHCEEVRPDNAAALATGADLVFLDPSRRDTAGRKVFLLEDCSPDILSLQDILLGACRHLLVKLSPMADITRLCKQLHGVRTIHVVAWNGECKELLFHLERGFAGETEIIACEEGTCLHFPFSEERSATPVFLDHPSGLENARGQCLFEPGKSLTKAGVFNTLCQRLGLVKLGRDTHLYLSPAGAAAVRPFGKCFEILDVMPMGNRACREMGKRYPAAEVFPRGLPLDSEALRKKIGCTSVEDIHIFGAAVATYAGEGRYLLACKRI